MLQINWILLYSLIFMGWVGLFIVVLTGSHFPIGIESDFQRIKSLLFTHPPMVNFGFIMGMWSLMSVAMMLPSFIPTLTVYNTLLTTGAGTHLGFWYLLGGYVFIWLAYSFGMASLQFQLMNLDVLGGHHHENSLLKAILLGIAGGYQFSKFKDNCLTYCRNPLTLFLARGNVSPSMEFLTGLRLGLWCLGCCFFLMLLCIIAGVMNFFWMGLIAIIILLEKLPDIGQFVSRPLGVILIVLSLGTTWQYFN